MSLLFAILPGEDGKRRRQKRRIEATPACAEPAMQIPAVHRAIIGRVDGDVSCADSMCGGGGVHDIIDSDRGMWLLECWSCGTGQWIEAIDGRLDRRQTAKASDPFEWPQDGSRFSGKPFSSLPRQFIAWAAENDGNEDTRKACQTWIASTAATV